MAFAVRDKRAARRFVFGAGGRLLDASPVLLGAMPGDDSVSGVAEDRRIASGCINVPAAFSETIVRPALGMARPP